MSPETAEKTLSIPEKNSIKNKMAVTFMHALNSTVNYHLNESGRDMDGLGIDFTLANALIGKSRTVASGANQINIQLKGVSVSSSSMFSENEHTIEYNLTSDLVQFGLAMYLIVVVLPKESEINSWRTINDDDVLLRARGYYKKVEGRLTRGTIQIPKTQQLTPESFKSLFSDLSTEVET